MAAVEDLQFRLLLIEALLDTAAEGIRAASVAPVAANLEHIAAALAAVEEILESIYAGREDLLPAARRREPPELDR